MQRMVKSFTGRGAKNALLTQTLEGNCPILKRAMDSKCTGVNSQTYIYQKHDNNPKISKFS
jgi:hypothetical protein